MNEKNRLSLLKDIVIAIDEEREKKKANDEEIKAEEKKLYQVIIDGTEETEAIAAARKAISKMDGFLGKRKKFNAKIKKLQSGINSIIRDENSSVSEQMTIEDFLDEMEAENAPDID